MRIITENDAINIVYDETAGKQIKDFLRKHENDEIHILISAPNGYNFDEKIIHDYLDVFKQFSEYNITLEYESKLEDSELWCRFNMQNYRDSHINGQRKDGNEVFSINKIIEDEDFLFKIAREINSKNFSPLEKMFAIYNLASSLKAYEEDEDMDAHQSRGLYEYMCRICEFYRQSRLFSQCSSGT